MACSFLGWLAASPVHQEYQSHLLPCRRQTEPCNFFKDNKKQTLNKSTELCSVTTYTWHVYVKRWTTYFPNTVYLRSKCGWGAYVMKNWLALVFGPLFATDTIPRALCCKTKDCYITNSSIGNSLVYQIQQRYLPLYLMTRENPTFEMWFLKAF
jgi:hypothetical protein